MAETGTNGQNLTPRQLQNDQLGAYYPDGGRHPFRSVVQGTAASLEPGDSVESAEVTLGFRSAVVPTREILAALDYDDARIEALIKSEVVKAG